MMRSDLVLRVTLILLTYLSVLQTFVTGTSHRSFTSGFYGCLFNRDLCNSGEICIHDGLLGHCQWTAGEKLDLYKVLLTSRQTAQLDLWLQKLKSDGYDLSHSYAQCILTRLLYSYRHNALTDVSRCRAYSIAVPLRSSFEPRVDAVLNGVENNEEDVDKELVALLERNKLLDDVSGGGTNMHNVHNIDLSVAVAEDSEIEMQLYAAGSRRMPSGMTPSTVREQSRITSGLFIAKPNTRSPFIAAASQSDVTNKLSVEIRQQSSQQSATPAYLIAVYVIAGIIGAGALALCIGLLVYICCCRRKSDDIDGSRAKIVSPNFSPFDVRPDVIKCQMPFTNPSLPWVEPVTLTLDPETVAFVMKYLEEHLMKKGHLLQKAWDIASTYEPRQCVIVAAQLPSNVSKNRYSDIMTYEHSRVHLIAACNINESDYINASRIIDRDWQSLDYIITQGPLSHTVADFWQMIWEQGCFVIVNLTSLTEDGVELCQCYWPETIQQYHIYEVKCVSEHVWCDDYCVRSFCLRNTQTGETRTVTQFHFVSWAEDKLPASADALLDFRRKVNNSFRSRSSPIVIHCSDGAGRSGTYLLIDMVLGQMRSGAKEMDIYATLQHIRDQRARVVRTKAQLEFVFSTVARELVAGYRCSLESSR